MDFCRICPVPFSIFPSQDLDELIRNFGTLERTAYTLFKSVCGGVSWGEPVAWHRNPRWLIPLVPGNLR